MSASYLGEPPAPSPVVARRLNGERVTILGWSRAILMQMAHPLIAAGVAQHSTFRGGARQTAARMHGTVKAMLALTFGDAARRDATLARIRGIHRTVNGTIAHAAGPFPAGTRYSADDPTLLLWVHATLLDSIPAIYSTVVAPLTTQTLDAFCEESAPTLLALGGDAAAVPLTWSALNTYLGEVRNSGVLHVTDEGRAIAEAVLWPRVAGVPMPGGSLHRLLTIGLLPPEIRVAYGFSWDQRRAQRLTRALRVLRMVRRITPAVLARWPDAEQRVAIGSSAAIPPRAR